MSLPEVNPIMVYGLHTLLHNFPNCVSDVDTSTPEYFEEALSVIDEHNKQFVNGSWYISIGGILDLIYKLGHRDLVGFLENKGIYPYGNPRFKMELDIYTPNITCARKGVLNQPKERGE
jgi:hypothetical protein